MSITLERPVAVLNLISPQLFDRLTARIARDEQTDQATAERIMTQTLAFLTACALNPGAGLVPSEQVDVGWHTFVLYTREYAEFCQRVAGRFIHHTPDDEVAGPGRVAGAAANVAATVKAMRAAGLPVDEELWSVGGDCSQCHAGCHDSPK